MITRRSLFAGLAALFAAPTAVALPQGKGPHQPSRQELRALFEDIDRRQG